MVVTLPPQQSTQSNGLKAHLNGVNGANGVNGVNGTQVQHMNGGGIKIQFGKTQNGVQQQKAVSVKEYVLEAVQDEQTLQDLAKYEVDYAHSIGFVGLWDERKDCNFLSVTPPLALLPSPFPRELFYQAQSVQQTLSELYFRISLDRQFLLDSYRDVVKADPFIARLVEIMQQVDREGLHQKLSLAIQRADYMSHWNELEQKVELKQVEVNIGQVGGPGTAQQAAKLHRKMLDKVDSLHGGQLPSLVNAHLAENKSRVNLARALYQAWKMVGDPDAVIVFMNQPNLFPVCHFEQLQFIQFETEKMAREEGLKLNVIRMSIKEAVHRLHLEEQGDFSLVADGHKRVALVHMAYGYLPEHYPTEKEWTMRINMERSSAIISPNIRLQLSGTKKIQQVLAKPGMIERFLPNQPEKVAELRKTFAGLWGLEEDSESVRAVIKEAIAQPRRFVLKAQLGAGKGNFFDEQMTQMLQGMSMEERGAYIIQEKIWPVVAKNYMLRPFKAPFLENIVSEMGIYGSLIGSSEQGGKVLRNSVDGYLVRSKAANVNQGGVSDGAGVIDSLLLFPASEFH